MCIVITVWFCKRLLELFLTIKNSREINLDQAQRSKKQKREMTSKSLEERFVDAAVGNYEKVQECIEMGVDVNYKDDVRCH